MSRWWSRQLNILQVDCFCWNFSDFPTLLLDDSWTHCWNYGMRRSHFPALVVFFLIRRWPRYSPFRVVPCFLISVVRVIADPSLSCCRPQSGNELSIAHLKAMMAPQVVTFPWTHFLPSSSWSCFCKDDPRASDDSAFYSFAFVLSWYPWKYSFNMSSTLTFGHIFCDFLSVFDLLFLFTNIFICRLQQVFLLVHKLYFTNRSIKWITSCSRYNPMHLPKREDRTRFCSLFSDLRSEELPGSSSVRSLVAKASSGIFPAASVEFCRQTCDPEQEHRSRFDREIPVTLSSISPEANQLLLLSILALLYRNGMSLNLVFPCNWLSRLNSSAKEPGTLLLQNSR